MSLNHKLLEHFAQHPLHKISRLEKFLYGLYFMSVVLQAYLLAAWLTGVFEQTEVFWSPLLLAWSVCTVARWVVKLLLEGRGYSRSLQIIEYYRLCILSRYSQKNPFLMRSQQAAALTTVLIEQLPALKNYYAFYQPAKWWARVGPVAFVLVVLYHDWVVGGLLLLLLPIIPLFMMVIGWGTDAVHQKYAESLQVLSNIFSNRLEGLDTIRRAQSVEQQAAIIQSSHQNFKRLTLKVLRIAFLSSAVLELFAALGVAMVAMYVGFRFLGFFPFFSEPLAINFGFFALFLAPEIFFPLRQFATLYHEKKIEEGVMHTLKIWEEKLEVSVEGKYTLGNTKTNTFIPSAYLLVENCRPKHTTMRVSLTIPFNSTYLIVGNNGVGKSAFLQSIAGVYPYEGNIIINDDSQLYNQQAAIFYLPSKPVFCSGTVADNIKVSNHSASDLQVLEAAKHAGLLEFLDSQQIFGELVGLERKRFSMGQYQRIALARLWLSDAKIILLDEPLSHQDRYHTDVLLSNILGYAKNKVLLMVSHETSFSNQFDQVCLLQSG